jgi:malonyl-CoA/methylmalonyl-CoA synthetase
MIWTTLVEAFHHLWCTPERAGMPALMDDAQESTYTYGDLHAAVGACAGWLRTRGVQDGDRIAISMERSSRQAIVILGAMAAGACPCPLEPQLGSEEVLRRSRVARFTWAVFDSAHQDEALQCGLPDGRYLADEGFGEGEPFWARDLSPGADGFLLFTSGSSGKPKGALQNHRGMLTNALGIVAHSSLGLSDRLMHVMPLYHTNGVNNQLLAPLLAGSCVVLASRFKAENMPALLERYHPTLLTGVPTMYSRMLSLEFPSGSLASVRMLRCGSAPITEELHRRIEDKFSLPLVISYGLSEATCTSTMNPPDRRKVGSVGTVLQGQRVFLRAPDGRTVEESGTEGEICVAGSSLMTGYLLEGADGVATPLGDVLRTGDLGSFDNEGYLFITGRLKDVIIRGGENLSPNLIEEVIASVSGVAACCVVGRAHADLGEVPVAFVVRERGNDGKRLTPAAIDGAVCEKLSRIHQPTEYFFVEALPENATGKVDRKQLREVAQSAVTH